jgi:hypothetical protein
LRSDSKQHMERTNSDTARTVEKKYIVVESELVTLAEETPNISSKLLSNKVPEIVRETLTG